MLEIVGEGVEVNHGRVEDVSLYWLEPVNNRSSRKYVFELSETKSRITEISLETGEVVKRRNEEGFLARIFNEPLIERCFSMETPYQLLSARGDRFMIRRILLRYLGEGAIDLSKIGAA